MKKNQLERLEYERPEVNIIPLQTEDFFCTSVRPKETGSEVEEWDTDEEKEFEIEI